MGPGWAAAAARSLGVAIGVSVLHGVHTTRGTSHADLKPQLAGNSHVILNKITESLLEVIQI